MPNTLSALCLHAESGKVLYALAGVVVYLSRSLTSRPRHQSNNVDH